MKPWSPLLLALLPALGCAMSSAATDEPLDSTSQAMCKSPPCAPVRIPNPIPLPQIATPDIAFEFGVCLTSFEAQLVSAINAAVMGAQDVEPICGSDDRERVGIWMSPKTVANTTARTNGVAAIALVQGTENYGARISSNLISQQANAAWEAEPRRIDPSGTADPSGPIHLNDFGVAPVAPNQYVTTIDGLDERPLPDVTFTMTTTDTMTASNGMLACVSANAVKVDESWLNELTAIAGFLSPELATAFGGEAWYVSANANPPSTTSGSVGCPAVALLPKEAIIDAWSKVVFSYSRVGTDANGITAAGTFGLAPRAPTATIKGATVGVVNAGTTSFAAAYTVTTTDLREPLTTYLWSSPSGAAVTSPGGSGTVVTFPLSASASPPTRTGSIHVHVVDSDGDTADADATVTIDVEIPPPSGPPPICAKKPNLPSCL